MTTINAFDGGAFDAYVATPARGSGPGIALLQEIYGVNREMRAIADGYAERGFSALAVAGE